MDLFTDIDYAATAGCFGRSGGESVKPGKHCLILYRIYIAEYLDDYPA
mgnify:CR=1 FL=1